MPYLPPPEFGVHLEGKLIGWTKTTHHLRRTYDDWTGIFQNLLPCFSGLHRMVQRKGAGCISFVRSEAGNFVKGEIGTGGYDEMIIGKFFPFRSNDLRCVSMNMLCSIMDKLDPLRFQDLAHLESDILGL